MRQRLSTTPTHVGRVPLDETDGGPGARGLAIAIALSAILAGWGAGTSADPSSIAEASPATLSGTVTVDGPSTVFPVSTAMATAFQRTNGAVKLAVQESGTGGGFKKFCAAGVDVAGAEFLE